MRKEGRGESRGLGAGLEAGREREREEEDGGGGVGGESSGSGSGRGRERRAREKRKKKTVRASGIHRGQCRTKTAAAVRLLHTSFSSHTPPHTHSIRSILANTCTRVLSQIHSPVIIHSAGIHLAYPRSSLPSLT